jgi:hypothetical protein
MPLMTDRLKVFVPPTESSAILPINVKDPAYGAVGDGVTDDSTAFLKALLAVNGNGSLFIPTGTYLLNGATASNGTGDTTNTSTSVVNATGTWYVGQTITGTGIPASTVVTAVSGTTLTISAAATATNTATALSARLLAVPLLSSYTGVRIFGEGKDLTTLKLSSGTKRLFDLFRTADYQTFQNIELSDFSLDANSQTTSANEHVLLGNLIGGAWGQRINATNIRVRRVKVTNATTDTTGSAARQIISIGSKHAAAAETQTNLTNILVEDCEFTGGNYGTCVVGDVASGASAEVYIDRVTIRRVHWDSNLIASSHGSSINHGEFAQIGGYGYGDKVLIHDCTGKNSGDVGIELDSIQNALIHSTRMVDCYNGAFFLNNFHLPSNLATQKNTVRDCEAVNSALDVVPGSNPSPHYQISGDSSTSARIFGEAVFENCISRWDCALDLLGPTTAAVGKGLTFYMDNTQARAVTIRNMRIGGNALVVTNPSGNRFPTFIGIKNAFSGSRVTLDGIHFRLKGSRAGSADTQWRMIAVHGAEVNLNANDITFDLADLSGLSSLDTFYGLICNDTTTTIKGSVRGMKHISVPGGSGSKHNGIFLGGTGTVTISPRLQISGCDFSKIVGTGSSQLDYNIDSTQAGKVQITDYIGTRSSTGAVDAAIASATTTTLAPVGDYFSITGTTTITSVTKSWVGRRVTLVFTGILIFTDGSNLKLAGNLTTAADTSITLVSDGTNWIETSRSVN